MFESAHHNWRTARQHDLFNRQAELETVVAIQSLERARAWRDEVEASRAGGRRYSRNLSDTHRAKVALDRDRSALREAARLRDEIAEISYDLGYDGYDDADGDGD